MAISSADISALPDYTDAEIVKMLKQAIIAVSTGQSTTLMGRTVTRANLNDLITALGTFEARATAAAAEDGGGGIALVQYGERV